MGGTGAGVDPHLGGEARADEFRQILANGRVAAFVRKNRGRDIAAACGQLANVTSLTTPLTGT